VNAEIRKTCDELVGQGLIAVAPDLSGVRSRVSDLRSPPRPMATRPSSLQASDRGRRCQGVKDTVDAVAKLAWVYRQGCRLGYCSAR